MKTPDTAYRLAPSWTIRQAGASLVVSGGADAQYEIELETKQPSLFATLKPHTSFTRADLTAADGRVLEQLVTAEIVVPVLQKAKALRIKLLGDRPDFKIKDGIDYKLVDGTYDLALIVRTTATYAELLTALAYEQLDKPHLFVDAAFHHTLSVGPLVFPGETACLACLQGRLGTRWGDEKPPAKPHVLTSSRQLIPALITTELARIAQHDTSLVGVTFAWNLQDRIVKKNQLLKVPLCPICTQNRIDPSGALALPWKTDESITDTV